MNRTICLLLCSLLTLPGDSSAQPLTLDAVYKAAELQYPLIRQRELVRLSGDYSLQNVGKGALPQLSVAGAATYQSDVTYINLPNAPVLSKDQYKIYAEAVQPLTDLIAVQKQREAQRAANHVAEDNVETELYKLRERINNIYFGILLLDEQRAQLALTKEDLQSGIDRVSAAVKNGTDFRSSLDKLKVESLHTDERDIELKAARTAYVRMLGLFLDETLPDSVLLQVPATVIPSDDINRPELHAFESLRKSYDAQSSLLNTKVLPKFSMFIQGGAGRPGLNFLDNDFKTYYLGGLRLNWSLSNFYTLRKEKAIIGINREITASQRETFLFNTNLSLQQQHSELDKLQALIDADREIIDLRKSIKTAALAQLQNGVITTNDYLREVLNEESAREQSALHKMQLLQANYNLLQLTGN